MDDAGSVASTGLHPSVQIPMLRPLIDREHLRKLLIQARGVVVFIAVDKFGHVKEGSYGGE